MEKSAPPLTTLYVLKSVTHMPLLLNCQHVHHYDTVYLLVDTRDLTKVEEVGPTLAHWPAVAAWWSSRLRHLGPGDEQVDLVFVRAAKETGLHLVHPTWAGTFVLAAMVFLFPNIHFVLLDSDCVPVTLFEIEELWALTTHALTFNRMSEPQVAADGPAYKARKTKQDDEGDNQGQRVILVTEPHTDINAGLVIILGSDHDSPLDLANAVEEAGQLPPTGQDEYWDSLTAEMLGQYRATTLDYLHNYNDPIYSTVEEQGKCRETNFSARRRNGRPAASLGVDIQDWLPSIVKLIRSFKPKMPCFQHSLVKVP